MSRRYTVEGVLDWNPCDRYAEDDGALLRHLLGTEGLTALEIADLAEVPVEDRLWVLLRVDILPVRELRLLACRWAEDPLLRERAAGREPDPRSWVAVEVGRRHADGKATDEELAAARADAWAARADAWDTDTTWAASRDAAGAAWDAAWAAWAAAGDAAWAAQLDDVRAVLVRLAEGS
jgi:hypothetical protein